MNQQASMGCSIHVVSEGLSMNIGVVYPQTEFSFDPAAIRDYAQTAESLGFTHVLAYDHVLGANPNRPGGWKGPYNYQSGFMEVFELFTFMSAHTTRLGFATGILILGQRQTALVAKQAATLDVLCGGKLRLGVGNGWNEVEYIALGMDFHNRGKRTEEQIDVLRKLWTHELVTYNGEWHTIPDAGLNPMPLQRPIPIWFGGSDDRVLDRVARLGDGWMPPERSFEVSQPVLDKLWAVMDKHGRKRDGFGVDARIVWGEGDPGVWRSELEAWKGAGGTHASFNTMKAGFDTPAKHIDAIKRIAAEVM